MHTFTKLIYLLDQVNTPEEKVDSLVQYLKQASNRDKLWAIHLLSGKRLSRILKIDILKQWAMEASGVKPWLLEQSQEMVKDWVETVSLILPSPDKESDLIELAEWMDFLEETKKLSLEEQKRAILEVWKELPGQERYILNKLIVGSFRFEVADTLLIRAISTFTNRPIHITAIRFYKERHPRKKGFEEVFESERIGDSLARFYPFASIENVNEFPSLWKKNFVARWKGRGERVQAIVRGGKCFLWNEGNEFLSPCFPECEDLAENLEDGTVLEGYISPLNQENISIRLKKKNPTQKFLDQHPVFLHISDLIEASGKDLRSQPFSERQNLLNNWFEQGLFPNWCEIMENMKPTALKDLIKLWEKTREKGFTGILLADANGNYSTPQCNWLAPPIKILAVFIYAHRDPRGASFVAFSFGVRKGDEWVPVAKIPLALSEAEMEEIHSYIKENTIEKFGPVRTVTPKFVFQLEADGIEASQRHKSGVLLQNPQIIEWKKELILEDAYSVEMLEKMIY